MKRMLIEAFDDTTTSDSSPSFQVRQQSAGKRRALNRDFATKLASITLTSGELCRLDAVFGGAFGTDHQLEQFNRAVSGCLCRLGRHAVDQRSAVIAPIGAVVGPVDLHQMAFPRRRIFVFQLGYFGFGQVADQKPDLVDYGPWMADMDIQGLPLPSDEFIEQKAQMLHSFLADSAHQQQQLFERVSVQRQNFKTEHHSSALDNHQTTTTTNGRTAAKNHCGTNGNTGDVQQQHQDDHDDDDIQVLEFVTALSTVKTEESDVGNRDGEMHDRQQKQQQAGGEQLEHDEDVGGRDSEQGTSDDAETGEPPLDQLVHSTEMLKGVRVTLSSLRQLVSLEPIRHNLVGCLVACRVQNMANNYDNSNKNNGEQLGVIVDEIVQADCDKLLFKHFSSVPLHLDKLVDIAITDIVFRDWIDNLTEWGESLPLFSLYRLRRCMLYDRLKKLKKSEKLSRTQRRKLRRAKEQQQWANQQQSGSESGQQQQQMNTAVAHQQQQNQQLYDETLVREFDQIFMCPRELVGLHQLGRSAFSRVAVGLYVRQHMGLWVEQIKRVSFGATPYTMYGQVLTTVLHFEHAQPCTINALHFFGQQSKIDFIKRHLFNKHITSEKQQQQGKAITPMQIKFHPPTADYVMRKSQQLRDELKK
ncbi:hypothetical protein niasHS_005185 [Heterodera schachtii]|uniref:Uncharacterized protein n=1 Tax=Heterodera schachtii TaxID=97005 RepID=A0ABD2JRN1_HETSC